MKKLIVVLLVSVSLMGCSSNDGKDKEKEREFNGQTSERNKNSQTSEGLHDKELAKKGVVRDKNGNFGPGSIDKVLGR